MQNRLPKENEIRISPCLAVIDLLQRTLAVAAMTLEEEFEDPWHRELGEWEIPGDEVRKALLHIGCLEQELDLMRRKLEMTIDGTIGPIPF